MHVWRGEVDRAGSQLVLRQLLARYLGVEPGRIELEVGEHGKPRLAEPGATLRFNLSHSGGVVLIALASGREVGVDVERIRPRPNLLRLAERALEPAAVADIRAAPPAERLAAFHVAWARHEALAKCHGGGLRAPLPPGPFAVTDVDAGAGFAAALAVAAEEMPPVERFELAAGPHDHAGHRL